ncbi:MULTISPECIES: transporter substrate-binding domain-containing protein [unclassified Paenibacillus]|uniref:transporter substrate-binding domain-containing protein n=1 Tax=unclassified Paenibacillus TaxID=185978 RepID=UPI001AE33B9C|nr:MULTISPECIES: transporter substrate-binding domain-containing protein [unclassified Paenibacillus]MBP1153755.1 glutamine transport system substrate-binding protein [Paenibacillus sp. PvP091]MBP1170860.1 glutamine transport system substrate-binding protein [Paenibacillus sp. PvR098]MBP2441888.1 glutamine transport system substrate-binding protein [Paenibacillus sp. PvP052]
MKYWCPRALLIFKLLILVILLASCGTKKTLQVGIENNLKPLSYVENEEKKGFEIELWDAIAKEAGFKYELKPMGMGEMVKAVESGKIDAGIAGITLKSNRMKKIDFTTPYYDTGLVLVTAADNQNIQSAKDLEKKVVATRIGTTGYDFLSKQKGIKEVQAYPDISQAYQALMDKKVDAVIFDEPNAKYFVQHSGKGKIKMVGKTLTNEQYAIALTKRSRYTGRISNALRTLSKNGTYERIYMKWFNEKPKSLPGDKE